MVDANAIEQRFDVVLAEKCIGCFWVGCFRASGRIGLSTQPE
jgi:hypothetical protein